MMRKLLILPRYDKLGASSRYRFYNYIDYLEKNGYECTIYPLFSDLYLTQRYSKSSIFFELIKCYLKRIVILFNVRKYDLCFIEKELFPYLPFWLEFFWLSRCKQYIVDYDDAIFHNYDENDSPIVRFLLSNKISQIMTGASSVIVGNQYIYDYAKANFVYNVLIIPTVIDLGLYDNIIVEKNKQFTIIWIGSQSTVHYVEEVRQSIIEVCKKTNGKFVVIGADINIPEIQLETVDWSSNTEIEYLKSAHVGIMPLSNKNWDKGKCGFKIIQYLASKIPVVASPVGINSSIIQHGVNGYLASTSGEWVDCLIKVYNNIDNKDMIYYGHKDVREKYSIDFASPLLLNAMNVVLDKKINLDYSVVRGFGKEWAYFNNEGFEDDLYRIWSDYFSIFPWNLLPDDGGIGADIGCGSGRWSFFVANKVKKLYLIDPSAEALEVSKHKLREFKNIEFVNLEVESAMQKVDLLDFAFSLGVLHHVPDIELAFESISGKLKRGAPFLVYLYYSFDNKPSWYKSIWSVSDLLRRVISRFPSNLKLVVTQLIAIIVYFPVARSGFFFTKLGFNTSRYPLIYYSDKPFYFMKNDALDRFGTKLENRFSRKDILRLFEKSGFINVKFSDSEPYWCACGVKK